MVPRYMYTRQIKIGRAMMGMNIECPNQMDLSKSNTCKLLIALRKQTSINAMFYDELLVKN